MLTVVTDSHALLLSATVYVTRCMKAAGTMGPHIGIWNAIDNEIQVTHVPIRRPHENVHMIDMRNHREWYMSSMLCVMIRTSCHGRLSLFHVYSQDR